MQNARFHAVLAVLACSLVLPASQTFAEERVIEEIIVTARQQEETLQDVPVTVAALSETDLKRYNITTITEAAKLIPNFQVFHGGSGNGSNIVLRGIGSSSISAAFDQSVAINIDGVVVNVGRFIHNAYMDMGQIEVLKGPQSLYFGKSATAGVVSITTQDPGDEFEAEVMVGYEWEHQQQYYEAVLSGPLSETFGARLAWGRSEADELFHNLSPNAANEYRGEEAENLRLTLVWEPNVDWRVRLKHSISVYDNDGANGRTEEICPEGTVQATSIPIGIAPFVGVDDCKLNGNTSIADLHEDLRAGLPYGGESGIPFLEQDTDFTSLQADWDINESLHLRSVTGLVDLKHVELDIYDYNAGVYGGLHRNVYDSFSQEFTLRTDLDGPFNFMVGAYYQDVEQTFFAWQYAFNAALTLNIFNFSAPALSAALGFDTTPGAMFGPDPATGRAYDYNKNHFLDTEVRSFFIAGYWDITDSVEVTAGARYTEEEKEGYITIPYVHGGLGPFGFGGFDRVDGLDFEDDNVSPEVAINWHATDNISVFGAWKKGFKSGGVDNSALPTGALNPNAPGFTGFGFLIYESEEAEGFEVGIKANLLDGAMRLNATAFQYEYTDLQVQLFNSLTIQFQTFNASALETTGAEADIQWLTPVEGLSFRGSIAFTDTEYSDEFINANGQDLEGMPGVLSADAAGGLGFSWDVAISDRWRMDFSGDLRYNEGYPLSATQNPFTQDEFFTTDLALRFYTADERYEFSIIGRNIGDEIVARSSGSRPGATPTVCDNNYGAVGQRACGPNDQDQGASTSLGRMITAQFRMRI